MPSARRDVASLHIDDDDGVAMNAQPPTETNWLERSIHWQRTHDVCVPYAAECEGHALRLRLGDFPAEDRYTLLVDGVETVSLSTWPDAWERK
jgi:hypothetical protein